MSKRMKKLFTPCFNMLSIANAPCTGIALLTHRRAPNLLTALHAILHNPCRACLAFLLQHKRNFRGQRRHSAKGDRLTGSPARKAQKKALRNSVLTAFVSDMMQYVFSSGVHCTCTQMSALTHSPHAARLSAAGDNACCTESGTTLYCDT